ncbi:MAG: GNAT family N-acetyltransferase [Lentisphaerae bacterium]|nr:GNAT family N-acetyltransferase [Lentisphaerota bacterium]
MIRTKGAKMNMASEVEIRTATIDDLAAIFHLGEKVFTPKGFSNLYRTWDEYEVTHLFNSETEYVLVAEVDGQVVGFAMGTIIEKARSAWSYGHLLWLGVDPDVARMSIGSLLFDRFREVMETQGIRMLLVDTQADNAPAITFFQRKGFENPTDHVYMTLYLGKDG